MYPFGHPSTNDTRYREKELWLKIQQDAYLDGIDLTTLPFAKDAVASIVALAGDKVDVAKFGFEGVKRVDLHTQ